MADKLPILKPAEMVKALEKAGFSVVRQTGSHAIMHKKGMSRPIPVPIHPGELKRVLQNRIIKEGGFTFNEFRQYL